MKIEFNLGDCGIILQPKYLARVVEALKLMEKMPYMDYLPHQMGLSGTDSKMN